jgi:hypothetical protein
MPGARVASVLDAAPASSLTTRFADQVRAAEATGNQVPHAGSSADRRCVDVNNSPNPKSGEFSVGGFALYDAIWHQGQGKLAWKPLHPDAHVPLVVRAVSLDAPATPIEYKFSTLNGSPADNSASYSSEMKLPRPGNWLLTAEAGPNWGCFLYTLR